MFLQRGVVGVVTDHLDDVPHSGLVLSDQLGVFTLLTREDANFLLFIVEFLCEGGDPCSYMRVAG